jgi:cyclophilin family peptidyl-prolyl cis-trans isomerase
VVCVTDRGAFTIALATDGAPNACAALLGQIARGLHDGLTFHRVVPDFVAQGGCPRGDGWGGPGYTVRSEWTPAPFRRGTVGLAHAGKDTGGSQWFVCLSDQPHLEGRYTVLGRVTEGMDVVDRLVRGDRYRLEVAGQTAPADSGSAGGV